MARTLVTMDSGFEAMLIQLRSNLATACTYPSFKRYPEELIRTCRKISIDTIIDSGSRKRKETDVVG